MQSIKFDRLRESLAEMKRVLIAYSGGVDSTLLLKTATMSDLSEILAVTSSSESIPKKELDFAGDFTASLKVRHRFIETRELQNKHYSDNPPDRCYYCKKELFDRLTVIAREEDLPYILDGTNADDAQDWRPGMRAARELGIRSPLLDAGLGKEEIRLLSKELGLPTWDKPATPCLSSRFPYGQKITAEALRRVDLAEDFIGKLGFTEFRVRNHAELARVEVLPEEFHLLLNSSVREELVAYLKKIGYRHIALDLLGFRSGSANEVLRDDEMKE
jgi:uncharacterized protein